MKSQLPSWLRALLAFFLSTGLMQANARGASAADLPDTDRMVIGQRQVLDDDLFIHGGAATIDGTVNGQVIVENACLVVNGIINGDLVATGGQVEIAPGARVAGQLLTRASQVNVQGQVLGAPQRLLQDSLRAYQDGRLILVKIADVIYASARDDYACLHTASAVFKTRSTLGQLQQRLAGVGFFRAHRSYLVNLSRIQEIAAFTPDSYNLRLNDPSGSQIPLSKRAEKKLRALLH